MTFLRESASRSKVDNAESTVFRREVGSGLSRSLARKVREFAMNYDDRTQLSDFKIPPEHMIGRASAWVYGYAPSMEWRKFYEGLDPVARINLSEIFESAIPTTFTTLGQIRRADKNELRVLVSSKTGEPAFSKQQAGFLKRAFGSFPIDMR